MNSPSVVRPGDILHIEKLAPDGEHVITYDGWLISDGDPILILARWEMPDLPRPYVTFARGDLLLEAYYRHRPYNVFALFDGASAPADADWGEIIARLPDPRPTLASLRFLCPETPLSCPIKGYYINFTRPVRYDPASRRLIWHDLALDIWIPAVGRPLVLDEDAYRALNLAQSEPELARAIDQARSDLLRQAAAPAGVTAFDL